MFDASDHRVRIPPCLAVPRSNSGTRLRTDDSGWDLPPAKSLQVVMQVRSRDGPDPLQHDLDVHCSMQHGPVRLVSGHEHSPAAAEAVGADRVGGHDQNLGLEKQWTSSPVRWNQWDGPMFNPAVPIERNEKRHDARFHRSKSLGGAAISGDFEPEADATPRGDAKPSKGS